MLNVKNFSVMAYANGFTLWNYSTTDKLPDLKSEGYFNAASPFVRTGDMIIAISQNKDGSAQTHLIFASKVTDDAITVSSLT
jgi:hypothetical protein